MNTRSIIKSLLFANSKKYEFMSKEQIKKDIIETLVPTLIFDEEYYNWKSRYMGQSCKPPIERTKGPTKRKRPREVFVMKEVKRGKEHIGGN